MTNQYDDQFLLLLTQNDLSAVAEELIDDLLRDGGRGASRDRVAYALAVALHKISSMHRRAVRQHIKEYELAPISSMGVPHPNNLYKRAQKHIQKRTLDMLATWMIGDVQLGDMPKIGLLEAAKQESAAGNGHFINAEFYRRLAEPMNENQLVKDYWKSRGAQLLHENILNELLAKTRSSQPDPYDDDRPSV